MNDKPTEVPTVAAILPSVERVVQRLQHVSIDEVAVARFARELNETPQLSGPEDDALLFQGPRESCANFCLLCDALNFCFWSDQGWELEFAGKLWTRTHAMIAGVLRAIDQDPSWLTADRWRDATMSDVRTWRRKSSTTRIVMTSSLASAWRSVPRVSPISVDRS